MSASATSNYGASAAFSGTQARATPPKHAARIAISDLDFFYGSHRALKGIKLDLPARQVTGVIGPSGCGKSTLLRVLNRMYDLYPGQRATGKAMMDDINIIDPDRVALTAPYIAHDLPTGAPRLLQRAEGYRATLVAGTCIQRDGEDTGARPGSLVRGHRTG